MAGSTSLISLQHLDVAFLGVEWGLHWENVLPLKKAGWMLQTPLSPADSDYLCIPLNVETICLKYLNTWKVSLWISLKILIFSKIPPTVKLYTTISSIIRTPFRPAAENEPGQCFRRPDTFLLGSEPLLRFCPFPPWTFNLTNSSRNLQSTTQHISPSHKQISQALPTVRREMLTLLTGCCFGHLDKQHPPTWNGISVTRVSINKECNLKRFILFFPR